MCHINNNIFLADKEEIRIKNSRLCLEERKIIQKMLNKKYSQSDIAKELDRDRSVVNREIKRHSKLIYKNNGTTYWRYSAAEADGEYKYNRRKAGRICKIDKDIVLKTFIEDKIKINKWFPEEIAGYIRVNNMSFKEKPNFQNIYYWIDKDKLNIKNIDLTHKSKLKKKKEKIIKEQAPCRKHKSIHLRPEEIDDNKEFGHLKMDCVEGAKNEKKYLTLLERKTKEYMVIQMTDKTVNSVVEVWNRLEKQYDKYFKYIFKTITTDNEKNFLDYESIEQSIKKTKQIFTMYYTDPYSAWQKGMNENCNGILRRFIPKGTKIGKISQYRLETIVYLINHKPRKILEFRLAEDLFKAGINNIMKIC